MSCLSIETPAKVNLFLNITGKQSNGYHALDTIFYPITNLTDRLTVSTDTKDGITLSCSNKNIPLDNRNLCWQAAELFANSAKITPAWHIQLEKNIPIAAGLGGGSSDAAATLLLLNKAYDQVIPEKQLASLALQIGADVPYFLNPTFAHAKGVGEELNELPLKKDIPLILINPKFPVSAAWAYKNCDAKRWQNSSRNCKQLIHEVQDGNFANSATLFFNILAKSVYDKFPVIPLIYDCLRGAGCDYPQISGSGPTIFAYCEDRKQAQVLNVLNKEFGNTLWSWGSARP